MTRVIHGDCLVEMRKLADDGVRVDAVVTDPPFVVPTQHYASRAKGKDFRRRWSDVSPLIGWFDQVVALAKAVTKADGHFVCFCNADSYAAFYPAVFSRYDIADCLVWDKGRIGMGRGWRKQHELIVVGRSSQSWFSDETISTVLGCPTVPVLDREHPAQKPVTLVARIIRHIAPPGGLILDPFAGSGTTLQAAAEEGFRAIGIEQEAEYVADIERRMANAAPYRPDIFAEVAG